MASPSVSPVPRRGRKGRHSGQQVASMARRVLGMAVDTHLAATPAARRSPGLVAVTEPTRFHSPDAFRAWLIEHQDSVSGLRVIIAKKDSSTPALTYEESPTVALQNGSC